MRLIAFILTACCMSAQNGEFERARQLLATGHTSEAAQIYRQLLRSQPDNPDLLVNLSIAEYKGRNYREAAASSEAALKVNPNLVAAHLFRGASYLEMREFDKAVDSLTRVIVVDPRERNGRLMLGEALLGAGRPGEAEQHFLAASELIPANPRVWYGLGRTYEAMRRNEDAQEAWRRLVTLPPSIESHLHSAEVHNTEHRWREEANELGEALKLAPENRKVRVGLAWSLFRSRDYQGAMATLKDLSKSDDADVPFLYGASLLNLQQPAEARPYLETAIARDPKLLPARAALGQSLLQTGKVEQAIPLLESALSVDQDGSIHFQLFRAYQLANRKSEAQTALTAYQRFRASLAAAP